MATLEWMMLDIWISQGCDCEPMCYADEHAPICGSLPTQRPVVFQDFHPRQIQAEERNAARTDEE